MNNIIKKKKLPRQPPKIMDLFRLGKITNKINK